MAFHRTLLQAMLRIKAIVEAEQADKATEINTWIDTLLVTYPTAKVPDVAAFTSIKLFYDENVGIDEMPCLQIFPYSGHQDSKTHGDRGITRNQLALRMLNCHDDNMEALQANQICQVALVTEILVEQDRELGLDRVAEALSRTQYYDIYLAAESDKPPHYVSEAIALCEVVADETDPIN